MSDGPVISVRMRDMQVLGDLLLQARSVAQHAAIERVLGTPDTAAEGRAVVLVSAAVQQMLETLRGASQLM